MATEWQGKSRGNVLGYRIFIFFIRNLGLNAAYFLLYFVAFYFLFASKTGRNSIFYYLHKRLGMGGMKAAFYVYKSYVIFGKTIIDRVSIAAGLKDRYTFDFDGVELLNTMLAQKRGGILISAHVGNFEIAEHFLSEIDTNAEISLLTTDLEHTEIKNYLDKVASKSDLKFIIVKEDMSHIFEIHNSLSKNGIICITGDRHMKGAKHMTEMLLGEHADFPAGPFLLGSRLKVPVAFVYVMKETKRHYHFYARPAKSSYRDAQGLLKEYTESLEWILKMYPLQWFNYFDFWARRDPS